MATIVVDELITKLEYEHDEGTLKSAESAVKQLEATNKACAASADKLSAENRKLAEHTDALARAQLDLAEQIAASSSETDKLVDEQRKLATEAKKAGGATKEQEQRLAALDAEIKRSRDQTRELREESSRLGREKQRVSAESRKLSRQQADVAKSSRKAATDQRALKDAMRSATERAKEEAGALDKLADQIKAVSIGELAADGVRALGNSVFEAGKQVIETGTNFESLRARLKTVEGSTEGAAQAFGLIQDFTRTTPFQLDEVTTAFVRLKSLGLDANRDSLAAFGNIAAAQGKSMIDFIEAVADASTGEFERLKEFGIKASSQGDQVAFTFAGTTTKVGKNAKDISAFLKELGETRFAGAMEDQMATTAGAVSNFKDTVSQTLDTLAQDGPLRQFNELLRTTTEGIAGSNGLGKALSEILTTALATATAAMSALQNEEVSGFLAALLGVLSAVIETLTRVGEALGPILEMWFQWWKLVGETIVLVLDVVGVLIDLAMALVDVLGPLLLLVPAFRALYILKVFLDLLEYFIDLLKRAVAAMDPFIDKLTNLIDRLPNLNDMFSSVTDAVRGFAVEIGLMNSELETTGSVAQTAMEALQNLRQSQGDYSQMSMNELQELRKQGDVKAEAEIAKRIKANEQSEEQQAADSKAKARQEAQQQRLESLLADPEKLSRDQLIALKRDRSLSDKQLAKVQKEIDKRLDSDFKGSLKEASRGQLEQMLADPSMSEAQRDKIQAELDKRKKKGAKSAQKLQDSLLSADITKQIDKLAEDAGRRKAARASLKPGGISDAERNAIELAERKAVKERLTTRFTETGQLPPGLATDLVQAAALPNIEETGGRLAPPVISVTNIRNEITVTGNEFNATVTVDGPMSGTPQQVAAAMSTQAMPVTFDQLSMTMQNMMTKER